MSWCGFDHLTRRYRILSQTTTRSLALSPVSSSSIRTSALPTLDASHDADFYALLAVSPSATTAEVKAAYHRALLKYHPDKQSTAVSRQAANPPSSHHNDIGLLKVAYETLATPELRGKYDARRAQKAAAPRPAQVISLEDFTELDEGSRWAYDCRCSGAYLISEADMDSGQHLVGCTSCSEVIWVGYEPVDEDEGEDA